MGGKDYLNYFGDPGPSEGANVKHHLSLSESDRTMLPLYIFRALLLRDRQELKGIEKTGEGLTRAQRD